MHAMQHLPHHLHLRKRLAKSEPFPSQKRYLRLLDAVVYVVGILSPILTIPQILDIYIGQDATGVSATSWGAYTLLIIPWVFYGIVHKEKVLIINSVLWLVFNALVFVGALIY